MCVYIYIYIYKYVYIYIYIYIHTHTADLEIRHFNIDKSLAQRLIHRASQCGRKLITRPFNPQDPYRRFDGALNVGQCAMKLWIVT